ncbi:hypothetical protein [Deinococcus sp.]|uniref:hypothetical protein n=1 Tax=Deinococcus sp. TaxID=47478 RepID=UPI002869E238|nr:hypothetical protein [Deinococcus sp.]
MALYTRLMLVITLAVTVTDLAWYYRLKRSPQRLTLPWTLAVIGITVLPIALVLYSMHLRGQF